MGPVQSDWFLVRDEDTDMQRDDHMRTQGDGCPLRTCQGEANPSNTLILDFRLQDCEEVSFCRLSPCSVALCYGGPGRLVHRHLSSRISRLWTWLD